MFATTTQTDPTATTVNALATAVHHGLLEMSRVLQAVGEDGRNNDYIELRADDVDPINETLVDAAAGDAELAAAVADAVARTGRSAHGKTTVACMSDVLLDLQLICQARLASTN